MAHSVEESGARLVMVLGHTQCSAIDGAVDRWLEKKASAWPWPSRAPQQGDVPGPPERHSKVMSLALQSATAR